MNRASLKITPGTDLLRLLQELSTLGPKLMIELGPQLVSLSAKTTVDFLQTTGDLITASLLKIELPKLPKNCCEIPETECPPRCVCEIRWKACQGGAVQATVQVTNTGSATRNFVFSATPFSGPGNPTAAIQVSPQTATVAPNTSVNVAVSFSVPADFQSGSQYTAELRVYGAYEQCVCIILDIEPPTSCAPERCEVRAGDIPVRIRAHNWYDHFQCTEPCTELLRQPQGITHRSRNRVANM